MSIEDEILNYLAAERFPDGAPKDLTNDYDLIDSGTIDSRLMVGLIVLLERQYSIQFGSNDIVPRNFRSINALAAFVRSQTGGQ